MKLSHHWYATETGRHRRRRSLAAAITASAAAVAIAAVSALGPSAVSAQDFEPRPGETHPGVTTTTDPTPPSAPDDFRGPTPTKPTSPTTTEAPATTAATTTTTTTTTTTQPPPTAATTAPPTTTTTTTTEAPAAGPSFFDNVDGCSEDLGILEGSNVYQEIERSGTTSSICTRYVPYGNDQVDDHGYGSAMAFHFELVEPTLVVLRLHHGDDADPGDRPFLSVLEGHVGPYSPISQQVVRPIDVRDVDVAIYADAVLDTGKYTAQIANYNWLEGGEFVYRFAIGVSDVGGDSNEAYIIAGPTRLTLPEYSGTHVGNYKITNDDTNDDPASAGLEVWLTGPDADSFLFKGPGELHFVSLPDYEARAANDGSNVFHFEINVTNGEVIADENGFLSVRPESAKRGFLPVSVEISDVNEDEAGFGPHQEIVGGV